MLLKMLWFILDRLYYIIYKCHVSILWLHSTTAYYEVLARDCLCFQYRDEDFREGPSLGYFFTEPEELIKQFINNPESFHTKMRELTDYVFGQYTDRPSSPDIVGVGGELLRDRIERERG